MTPLTENGMLADVDIKKKLNMHCGLVGAKNY